MSTTKEDQQRFYICGQCNTKQYYLVTEEPEVPCPDCGWQHKSRKKYDVPSQFKVNLGDF